ncbi:MAG: hypothetical protein WC155_03075 [Candidatus Cloacimonadales bacterium]
MNIFLKTVILIMIIVTISCSASVSGKKHAMKVDHEKIYAKTIYFMPYETQNIQIVHDDKSNNLLIVSYITLDKARFNNLNEFSFILDEDTRIKAFTINRKAQPIERILTYDESNFNNQLKYDLVEKIRFFGNLWKFKLTDEELAQDKIELMIKYTISNQSKDEAYHKNKAGFTLNGNLWWYPSTFLDGGTIKLNLNIKDSYEVTLSGNPVPFESIRSYKFYQHTVQNLFDTPLNVEAKKAK